MFKNYRNNISPENDVKHTMSATLAKMYILRKIADYENKEIRNLINIKQ